MISGWFKVGGGGGGRPPVGSYFSTKSRFFHVKDIHLVFEINEDGADKLSAASPCQNFRIRRWWWWRYSELLTLCLSSLSTVSSRQSLPPATNAKQPHDAILHNRFISMHNVLRHVARVSVTKSLTDWYSYLAGTRKRNRQVGQCPTNCGIGRANWTFCRTNIS